MATGTVDWRVMEFSLLLKEEASAESRGELRLAEAVKMRKGSTRDLGEMDSIP